MVDVIKRKDNDNSDDEGGDVNSDHGEGGYSDKSSASDVTVNKGPGRPRNYVFKFDIEHPAAKHYQQRQRAKKKLPLVARITLKFPNLSQRN